MPCSKGMRSCAALCGHRSLVEGYRDERRRQWSELIEFTKGYSTEIADRLVELRENGTPLIDYKTWLIQNARPPEDRDMPTPESADATLSPSGIGDPAAEQILLASIMEQPEHAAYLRQFRDGEFTEPLHQLVVQAIQDLDRQGIEPAASTVENWLRENNMLAPTPEWDSQFYRPGKIGDTVGIYKDGELTYHNRKDLGLRGWHQVAGPGIGYIEHVGSVVRDNTILRQTTDAHLWAADRLKETAQACVSEIPELTQEINYFFQRRMDECPPRLPIPGETPRTGSMNSAPVQSPAMQYTQAQTVAGQAAGRSRAQMVKVG